MCHIFCFLLSQAGLRLCCSHATKSGLFGSLKPLHNLRNAKECIIIIMIQMLSLKIQFSLVIDLNISSLHSLMYKLIRAASRHLGHSFVYFFFHEHGYVYFLFHEHGYVRFLFHFVHNVIGRYCISLLNLKCKRSIYLYIDDFKSIKLIKDLFYYKSDDNEQFMEQPKYGACLLMKI